MDGWTGDVCISDQSDWSYCKQPIQLCEVLGLKFLSISIFLRYFLVKKYLLVIGLDYMFHGLVGDVCISDEFKAPMNNQSDLCF